ncbi:MAG: DNA polymerase IV [Caldisericia bacterium]|nr:DNA polymerase IV [Caldisericia bacterium]
MKNRFLFSDADMFFVSAELAQNPALKGLPVMVGAASGRGVISAASYEARKYGVHSGMSGYKAHKLCPHGIYLKGNYRLYSKYSKRMFSIFSNYSPDVHIRSIDEGFIEISSCLDLFGGEEELALQIKDEIRETLGITISIGIASTLTISKIATEEDKPDGLTIIPQGGEKEFLRKLPIGRIPGIGKKAQERFQKKGIFLIGDLYRYNTKNEMVNQFGAFGNSIWNLTSGISTYQENHSTHSKSISNESTFYKEIKQRNELEKKVMLLSEKAGFRMRKNELKAKTVFVKIRYSGFKTITRRLTIQSCIESDNEIFQIAWKLISKEFTAPIRLIGIGLSNFQEAEDLFSFVKEKDRKFDKAIDMVREKYGRNTIYHGK